MTGPLADSRQAHGGLFGSGGFLVGLDLTECRRFGSSPTAEALQNRILSVSERSIASQMADARRAEFVAGRFAAKEAVLKALGIPMGDGSVLSEIEVLKREDGSPELVLRGAARAAAQEARAGGGRVSISHSGGFACAIAVFTTNDERQPA